jgi:hypothetical protein
LRITHSIRPDSRLGKNETPAKNAKKFPLLRLLPVNGYRFSLGM